MILILETAGAIIMFLGLCLMFIGIIGIFKFKCFYARILVVTKLDTVGTVVFLFGLLLWRGLSFFSGKLLLIIIIILILSPLVGHIVARSAHISGLKLSDPNKGDGSYEGDGL
jgi:multicomponent Na+:H+ antiporter subunit G